MFKLQLFDKKTSLSICTDTWEFEILFQIECVMYISNLTLDEFNIVSFEESEWLSFTIHYESFHCTNLQKSESHLSRKSHSDLIRVVYSILMVDFYFWGVMFEVSCLRYHAVEVYKTLLQWGSWRNNAVVILSNWSVRRELSVINQW